MSFLILLSGCGESNYLNDPDSNTEELNALAAPGEAGARVREHWTTLSEMLYDRQVVTYSPINGTSATVQRITEGSGITVRLSLLETDDTHMAAFGSIRLDDTASITNHPLEVVFKNISFEADAQGVHLVASGSNIVLTTKTESGTLIQPQCTLTLDIKETYSGRFFCKTAIDIAALNRICEFNIEIYRSGEDEPISFYSSHWAKKNRTFEISYPRKQYTEQAQTTAGVDDNIDLFTFTNNTPESTYSGSFHLPPSLSPNGSAITIDLNSIPLLKSSNDLIAFEARDVVNTPDLEGTPIQMNYRLLLKITRKIVLESQNTSDCESLCMDRCAAEYTGESLTECQDRCVGSACVQRIERYTLTASLELDQLNMRTSLTVPVNRTDAVDVDENDDGFHDNFDGAAFKLPAQDEDTGAMLTYSVTHAISTGTTKDVVQVPYDQVGFILRVSAEDGAVGIGVNPPDKIALPDVYTPLDLPYLAISLAGLQSTLNESDDGLTIGVPPSDDPEAEPPAEEVTTIISKNYTSVSPEVAVEEEGQFYLTINPIANGAYECNMIFTSTDGMTNITITAMEVYIKEPASADNGNINVWDRVESPRQPVVCSNDMGITDNNFFESDVAVNVNLSRQWKNSQEHIVATGDVLIQQDVDCLGAPLAFDIPADTFVDIAEAKDGFTLISDNGEFNLSINLVKTAKEQFEYQVNFIKQDTTDEITFDLPALRTTGTGVFITNSQ